MAMLAGFSSWWKYLIETMGRGRGGKPWGEGGGGEPWGGGGGETMGRGRGRGGNSLKRNSFFCLKEEGTLKCKGKKKKEV